MQRAYCEYMEKLRTDLWWRYGLNLLDWDSQSERQSNSHGFICTSWTELTNRDYLSHCCAQSQQLQILVQSHSDVCPFLCYRGDASGAPSTLSLCLSSTLKYRDRKCRDHHCCWKMLFYFHHVLYLPHDDVCPPYDVDTLSKHSQLKHVQTKLVEESVRESQSSNVRLISFFSERIQTSHEVSAVRNLWASPNSDEVSASSRQQYSKTHSKPKLL